MELKSELYQKVTELCEEGDKFFEDDNYNAAVLKYNEALEILPFPKNDWEASTWIYTALGDTYYMKKNYKLATECLYNALNCPDSLDNPFVNLRLGQSLYEIREFSKAKEYLLRAFMIEGYSIFNGEDNKYFELIEDII